MGKKENGVKIEKNKLYDIVDIQRHIEDLTEDGKTIYF